MLKLLVLRKLVREDNKNNVKIITFLIYKVFSMYVYIDNIISWTIQWTIQCSLKKKREKRLPVLVLCIRWYR